jgi:hypothetical protein
MSACEQLFATGVTTNCQTNAELCARHFLMVPSNGRDAIAVNEWQNRWLIDKQSAMQTKANSIFVRC